MKIASYASKSITDFTDFLVSTPFYHRLHTGQISTADFLEIKRGPRQHFFLSSTSYRPNFNSWLPRDQTGFSPAPISIIGPYRLTSDQLVPPRSNGASASTHSYHRLIQVNIWSTSLSVATETSLAPLLTGL